MADQDIRFTEMILALKERDFRLTPQRIELVRLIATSQGHPSATQLYDRIKRQFPTMSHATVYKTLSLLKDMGQVLEIDLRDDSHYDGIHPQPHPHLICIRCNRIIDGEADLDPKLISKLEHASGYTIIRSQISFFGLCPECKTNKPSNRKGENHDFKRNAKSHQ
jgi:Fur family peroxide stress response transcriptional regulator